MAQVWKDWKRQVRYRDEKSVRNEIKKLKNQAKYTTMKAKYNIRNRQRDNQTKKELRDIRQNRKTHQTTKYDPSLTFDSTVADTQTNEMTIDSYEITMNDGNERKLTNLSEIACHKTSVNPKFSNNKQKCSIEYSN